jgi:hypothetical protein
MTENHPKGNGAAPVESPIAALDRLAVELEDVGRRAVGTGVEYDRAGVVFAAQEAGRLSFRLRAEIVVAALRTAATARSSRGPEWVALASAATDVFALDRAVAWFETAWRFAGEPDEETREGQSALD